MPSLGQDPSRQAALPGTPDLVLVSVAWVQSAYNSWRPASASAIRVDNRWGPQTLAAITAMASSLHPPSLSHILPQQDGGVIITKTLESKLAGQERRVEGVSAPRPQHPITDAGEEASALVAPPISDPDAPIWPLIALGGACAAISFVATFVLLDMRK